jgi:hypothetical protein
MLHAISRENEHTFIATNKKKQLKYKKEKENKKIC